MGDLDRVDDAGADEVAVLAGRGVVALAVRQLADVVDHHGAVDAGVVADPVGGLGQRAGQGADAHGLVAGELLGEGLELAGDLHQHRTAAGDDALLHRGARGVDGVLDAQLALVDLGLGGRADADDGDAAGQLGQALLQLFAIPRGIGALDFVAQVLAALLDGLGGAGAVDDDGLVLGDGDAAGVAQHLQADLLQLHAGVRGDHGAVGDDGEVLHELLAAVAEVRGLHGRDLQGLAHGVDDQGGQGLALDVLGHDQGRLARLRDLLQQREEVRQRGDLLADEQHLRVLEDRLLGVDVGDEVRGQVALVEGHALGHQ